MIRLGDVRDYTYRDPEDGKIQAINVDGLRSRRGDEYARELFEVVDDAEMCEADGCEATWTYHANAEIDEGSWLRADLIVCARTGDLFGPNGALWQEGWAMIDGALKAIEAFR